MRVDLRVFVGLGHWNVAFVGDVDVLLDPVENSGIDFGVHRKFVGLHLLQRVKFVLDAFQELLDACSFGGAHSYDLILVLSQLRFHVFLFWNVGRF